MKKNDPLFLETFVNIRDFPLHDPSSDLYPRLVQRVKEGLIEDGCSVLEGFIRPEWHETIRLQGMAVAPQAHYKRETVNAYNLPLDAPLGEDHPARITMVRENAFVARDLIPQTDIIHQLFENDLFNTFLADCFGYARLFQLADPLAGLCLNVLRPGCAHPWHFDVNEFTVSLLTKRPEGGGVFRYCPGIRSLHDENLEDVRRVLSDEAQNEDMIKELALKVGDLQLFQGRYALHQVSPVKGSEERHSAIFAYTQSPDVISGPERTRQLFGRVLPVHYEAERARVRADELLD